MLRITTLEGKDRSTVLKLEGRLVDRWVELLRATCKILQSEIDKPLILDLSAVGFASRGGIDLLRHLQKEGVRCISWSPFLKELAQHGTPEDCEENVSSPWR